MDSAPRSWIPWMRRALQLASLGTGRTSPNPLVGATVLDAAGPWARRQPQPGMKVRSRRAS
jgi:hypothetical protein